MTLVVKTDGNPLALAGSVRDAVRAIDRNLPVSDIRTMEDVTAAALAQPRFVTFLLALFAGTALTLAAIGIYGTISLLVAERTQEMGIRLALGADRPAILKLVLGQGLLLTAIGLVGRPRRRGDPDAHAVGPDLRRRHARSDDVHRRAGSSLVVALSPA